MTPSPARRAPGAASRISRSRLAARRTALPVTKVCRDAVVAPPSSVRAVSPTDHRDLVVRHPQFLGSDLGHHPYQPLAVLRRAHSDLGAAVSGDRHLCPGGVRRRHRPDRRSCSSRRIPRPAPCRAPTAGALPAPGRAPRSRTRSMVSSSPTPSRSSWPVEVTLPAVTALRRRSSSGCRPRRPASSSMALSMAKAA